MFKKLLSLENTFTVTRAATIVGFFTLLSKVVAAVRDPLLTSKFGGDRIYVLDVYNAAFRIPDFLFTMFIAGTLSVAFIPIFVELLVIDEEKAQRVSNTVVTLSMLGMGFLFFLVLLFAHPLAKALVPGFTPDRIAQTASLMRLIALSQIIFTLSNTCTNILYAYKRFIFAGFAPVLYNGGIIVGILFFYDRFGIQGLGYGVLLGALLHLVVQVPELVRASYRLRPAFFVSEDSVKKFWKLYVPRIFVIDLSVFSLLISTFVASGLATGSIAIFSLAVNLQSIPISIISLSLATAVFPALSEAFATKDNAKFMQLLKKTISQVLYFIIPISILMLVFRAQIVRLYYGHGRFSWDNTILTFSTLGVLCFSLLSQSLSPILARAFYSRQNTIIPVCVNLLSMGVNIILASMLAKPYGVVGIAEAFTVASIFNALLLFVLLRRSLGKTESLLESFDKPILRTLGIIIISSLLLGFASYGGLYVFASIFNTHTTLGILLQLCGSSIVGIAVFLAAGNFWGLEETAYVLRFVKKYIPSAFPKR